MRRGSLIQHAGARGVSLDSFVASVLSQRVAVAEADSYIRRRASRGSSRQMLEILAQAPKVEPDPEDRLEATPNGEQADRAKPGV